MVEHGKDNKKVAKTKQANKKTIIIVVLLIIAILGGACFWMFSVMQNNFAKTEGLLNTITMHVNNGEFVSALDVFKENTYLETKHLDLKEDIQNKLYLDVRSSMELLLDQCKFTEANDLVVSHEMYLATKDLTELKTLYNDVSYEDTLYRVSSMLYSLNLSKELAVALTDIVETNWNKTNRLDGIDSQVRELNKNRDYAYRLFESLVHIDDLSIRADVTNILDDNNDEETIEINTEESTEFVESIMDTLTGANLGVLGSVMGLEVELLTKNLFIKYNVIYNELFNTKNDILNYRKDVDLMSREFDVILGQIFDKNKSIKDAYERIAKGTQGLYELKFVEVESKESLTDETISENKDAIKEEETISELTVNGGN